MGSMYTFPEALQHSLSLRWSEVLALDPLAGRALFTAFVGSCVREGFARKFTQAFNGSKPVTERLLRGHVERGMREPLDEMFDLNVSSPLAVTVIWGSFENPIAFSLKAKAGRATVRDLFVEEGDALASVSLERGATGFLLLTGARGQLLRFPGPVRGAECL